MLYIAQVKSKRISIFFPLTASTEYLLTTPVSLISLLSSAHAQYARAFFLKGPHIIRLSWTA